MKMISGYLEPDQGDIQVNGLDISTHAQQIQQQLGYLPENLPIYPEMTVADYLDYAAVLKALRGERKNQEIRRVIEATDIANKLLAPINTLSRGYKQRVGVAQALLGQPKLLILDEPTNGLDPTQTELMRQLIRDIASEATVILSTHIMQEVESLCSRVLILRDGRLAIDKNLEQHSQLLLQTSVPPQDIAALLADIGGLDANALTQAVPEDSASGYQYALALHHRAKQQQVSADVARAVIGAGADLYQLKVAVRDLATLFREVNAAAPIQEKERLTHAA